MLKDFLVENGFLWGPEENPYGVSGFMTYAPVGKRVKNKIEANFRQVFKREGFDEIETPVLNPQETWEASGHLEKFKVEMFKTQTSKGQPMVARTEMATTIYPLFDQLLNYYRGRMPFKIYQTGVVLPNDLQTEWQVRTRQYTSHEGHIFYEPRQVDVEKTVRYLMDLSMELMQKAGIPSGKLEINEKTLERKPFYAAKAYGLYADTDDGDRLEVLGIQYRTDRDFKKHSQATGKSLRVRGNYPEVFEISFSSDRPFFLLIGNALKVIDGRTVLQLPDDLAPYQVAIASVKNTNELFGKAKSLSGLLNSGGIDALQIESRQIGQKYKKADAIGVPFVFTIDERSLSDGSFTIRERDSRRQVRVSEEDVDSILSNSNSDNTAGIIRKLFKVGLSR